MSGTTLHIRVKQALTWLKRNKGILQKDIADKMGITETSFTRGMARIKEKNDEDFVISFHSAVSKFISLEYLMYGRGELIVQNENADSVPIEAPATMPSSIDRSFLIEKEIGNTKSYMEKYIASLEDQVKILKNDVAQRDKTIDLQDRLIQELKVKIKFYQKEDPLKEYPFEMGVAERNNNIEQVHV